MQASYEKLSHIELRQTDTSEEGNGAARFAQMFASGERWHLSRTHQQVLAARHKTGKSEHANTYGHMVYCNDKRRANYVMTYVYEAAKLLEDNPILIVEMQAPHSHPPIPELPPLSASPHSPILCVAAQR